MQLAFEGGQIALHYRENSSPSLKSDRSVVTRADQEVSALAHGIFKDFLKRPDHILIDEEDEKRLQYLNEDSLQKFPYIFAIDPVDGTRGYANRMPHFGISIGLLKCLKPWLGVVYFPVLKEIFYCDGERSYFVQNAFQKDEVKAVISPIDQEINKQAIFLLPDSYFNRFEWDFENCHIMIPACAAVDLCWPAVGRGCGSLIKSYLWDFAGSWPIVQSAGLDFRHWRTGKVLDNLTMESLDQDKTPWKLKEYYIVSSERNFPILQRKITPKKKPA